VRQSWWSAERAKGDQPREKDKMRKWYVPLTLMGLGGLGVLCLTERGRKTLRWIFENVHRAPESFLEWNEAAQRELDRIQTALNRVADSLQAVR
jgi:hypothetical protein